MQLSYVLTEHVTHTHRVAHTHASINQRANINDNFRSWSILFFYCRNFGAKCSKCCRGISASDWVRRARDLVFHLACFACDQCGRQLSTGEQFALMDDRVLCKAHYLETVEGGTTSSDGKRNQAAVTKKKP